MSRRRISAWLLALTAALSALASPVFADDLEDQRDDLVNQQQETDKKIEGLQSSLEGVDVDLQSTYLKLQETQGKIPGAEAAVRTADAEVAAAQREAEAKAALLTAAETELTTIETEIVDSKKQADDARASLGQLARATYRGDTTPSTIDLLAGAKSTDDFLNAYRINSAMSRAQNSALNDHEQAAATARNKQSRQTAVKERVTELKKEADQTVVVKEEKQAAAEAARQALATLEADLTAQSAALETQKTEFQASIASAEKEQESTASRIAQIDKEIRAREAARIAKEKAEAEARAKAEAAAKAKSNSGNSGSSGSSGGSSSGSTSNRKVSASWIIPPVPAPVYVTSPFGMREYPFGGRWMHNGVDLRSRCGEAQVAAADGVISATVPAAGNSTHGNQVYIDHGYVNGSTYITVTNHLSAFNVVRGQTVKKGDVIGWTGQTGLVTACHVHFEVWKNGSVVNPMNFSSFTRRYG